jgi:hypothetical protein
MVSPQLVTYIPPRPQLGALGVFGTVTMYLKSSEYLKAPQPQPRR